MADKPTEDFLWAESAAGGDISDPSAKRTAGYLFEDPWPHEEANYMFRAVGRYLKWLGLSAGGYDYPQKVLDFPGLAAGDTFVSGDSGAIAGSSNGSVLQTTNAGGWYIVTTDGEFIIAVEKDTITPTSPVVHVFDPSGRTAERTFTTTMSTVTSIACNGSYIAVGSGAVGGNIEVYDYDGNSEFTAKFDTSDTVFLYDLEMDGSRLLACGGTGGAANEVQTWTLSTGVAGWTYAHGADVYGAVRGQSHFFLTAAANGSAETFLKITATGGAAAYTGVTAGYNLAANKPIAQDENHVFIQTSSVNIQRVNKFGTTLVDIGTPYTFPATVERVLADDRYMYAVMAGEVRAVNKDNETCWDTTVPSADIVDGVGTGQFIYLLNETTTPFDMYEINLGRRPGIWKYVGPAPTGWMRWKFIPGD